ncbi:MAG: outer membrane beta-barrel family protein, partial [Lewinella sp.]
MLRTLTFLFLVLPTVSFTQSSLTGYITDEAGTPLAGATVVLYTLPDSVFVRGEACDQSGVFTFDQAGTPEGYLEVRAVGYATTHLPLREGEESVEVQLRAASEMLGEVRVSARRTMIQQQADRLVINPGSQVTATGGTALDFLEKSPGVAVNRVSQSLSLNGREGVLVMINGKIRRLPADALLQQLQGISLNDVEQIELITNPPAKYEAGGSGGIIHIITKNRETRGTSGNVGAGLNYRHGLGGQINASLQWNTDRMNGFASYAFNYDRAGTEWYEELFVPIGSSSTAANSYLTRVEVTPVHNLSLGLTYDLGERTTAEVLLTGYRNDFFQNGTNAGSYRQAGSAEVTFESELYEENYRSLATAYGGLTHQLHKNHRLSGSVEYIYSHQDQPSFYDNELAEAGEVEVAASKVNPLSTWIGKVDYTWQLSPANSLSFGTKYNTSYFDNRVEITETANGQTTRIDALSNRSELEESIMAFYASGLWQMGEKWTLRTGVRTERTQTDLLQDEIFSVVDRDYTNWFLNLSAEYEIDERNRLSVSYGERITRPTFGDLAPFVFYPNPVTVFYGNPSLLPSRSYTAGVRYSRGGLGIGLEYSTISDLMVPFHPDYDADLDLMFRFSKNLDRARMLRLQLNLPLNPAPWLEWQSTVFLVYNRIIPEIGGDVLTNPELSYQGNLTVTLPHGFSLGAGGNFYYRQTWGNFYMKPYGHFDLGVTKKLSGLGATLALTFVDVFDTFGWDVNPLDGAFATLRVRTQYIHGMRAARL